jgi:peptidoglycan/LPS O-acetylase OafA/YrhL
MKAKSISRIVAVIATFGMAIGALVAYYLFHKQERVLQFLYHRAWLWACVAFFISFFIVEFEFFGHTIFEALVSVTLILNVSTNPKCWIKFRWSGFTILGNISYGIYMYHTLVLAVLINVGQKLSIDRNHTVFNFYLYLGGVAGTLLISWLSYRYFESFFLTIKERFMVVKSSSKG